MKKKICVLLLVSIVTTAGYCQKIKGWASYQVSRDQIVTIQELFFEPRTSIFVKNNKATPPETTPPTTLDQFLKKGDDVAKDDYVFKDLKTNRMKSNEYLKNGTRVIVEDSIPNLAWKLHPDTKQIGGFKCQKATTTFRCADYTGWFTMEVPVGAGPWKLGGLPGLILELRNENVMEVYTLTSLEYPTKKEMPSMPSVSQEKVYLSYKNFGKDQREEMRKLVVFLKSRADFPEGGEVRIDERECY